MAGLKVLNASLHEENLRKIHDGHISSCSISPKR